MQTNWDPDTRLPIPPVETLYPADIGMWATILFTAVVIPVLVYGLVKIRERQGQIVLLLMLGGLLTVTVEPWLDIIGGAWHPEINQVTAFESLGRPIPIWVVPIYVFFFGGLGSLNYLSFKHGATRKVVWLWFSIPALVDIVQEEIMMYLDLYYYYGNQPLILFREFPLWWAASNTMGEFLGVTALVLLMPYLRGWRLLFIPLIFPISDAVGFAITGLPSIYAVNTQDIAPWLMHSAGIATWILALLVVHLVSYLIAIDSPRRQDNTIRLQVSST